MAILRWGRRWDPLEDLEKMRREMERLFRGATEAGSRAGNVLFGDRTFPLVNVYETSDDYVATAEIPGVELKDLEISVTGDALTVKGKRTPDVDYGKVNCHRRERDSGSFARTVTLPRAVATDKVEAQYVSGVLQVKLPKAEEAKPRVVAVE